MQNETAPPTRYLFIVARNRPDILERVRERLHGDERIEVIVDRRYGERRREDVRREPARRAETRAVVWGARAKRRRIRARVRAPACGERLPARRDCEPGPAAGGAGL